MCRDVLLILEYVIYARVYESVVRSFCISTTSQRRNRGTFISAKPFLLPLDTRKSGAKTRKPRVVDGSHAYVIENRFALYLSPSLCLLIWPYPSLTIID